MYPIWNSWYIVDHSSNICKVETYIFYYFLFGVNQ